MALLEAIGAVDPDAPWQMGDLDVDDEGRLRRPPGVDA